MVSLILRNLEAHKNNLVISHLKVTDFIDSSGKQDEPVLASNGSVKSPIIH